MVCGISCITQSSESWPCPHPFSSSHTLVFCGLFCAAVRKRSPITFVQSISSFLIVTKCWKLMNAQNLSHTSMSCKRNWVEMLLQCFVTRMLSTTTGYRGWRSHFHNSFCICLLAFVCEWLCVCLRSMWKLIFVCVWLCVYLQSMWKQKHIYRKNVIQQTSADKLNG